MALLEKDPAHVEGCGMNLEDPSFKEPFFKFVTGRKELGIP